MTLTALLAAGGAVAMVLSLTHAGLTPQSAGRAEPLGQVAAQEGALMNATAVRDLLTSSARSARSKTSAPAPSQQPSAPPPVYLNPFRGVAGLSPQRIDMGVDFGGTGPVYPIGDGQVISATASNWGWPGGGWVTYQLTDGPAAGLVVYVAEDVRPAVQAGEHVTATTVIGTMYYGGDDIETGWAMPDGSSSASQLAAAGGIGGTGPFPTMIGANFDQLLIALGVPAAPNAGQAAYGALPLGYPATWTGV